jgi:hypothetical protein
MTCHIVSFDMIKVGRLLEPGDFPIQMFQPSIQFRIPNSIATPTGIRMSDGADIGLEVLHVHGIEADDGDVQTDIHLSELGPEKVLPGGFSQHVFQAVEGLEEREDIILVGLLGARKATFVDTSVSPEAGDAYPLLTVS